MSIPLPEISFGASQEAPFYLFQNASFGAAVPWAGLLFIFALDYAVLKFLNRSHFQPQNGKCSSCKWKMQTFPLWPHRVFFFLLPTPLKSFCFDKSICNDTWLQKKGSNQPF